MSTIAYEAFWNTTFGDRDAQQVVVDFDVKPARYSAMSEWVCGCVEEAIQQGAAPAPVCHTIQATEELRLAAAIVVLDGSDDARDADLSAAMANYSRADDVSPDHFDGGYERSRIAALLA